MSEDRLVLDTSAIMIFLMGEEGYDQMERLFEKSQLRKAHIWVSFITLMEILYVVWHEAGEQIAEQKYLEVQKLPLIEVWPDEKIRRQAARIKATHSLSVADAWIAATAMEKGATLVHKDREFEPLRDLISQIPLYSPRKKRV